MYPCLGRNRGFAVQDIQGDASSTCAGKARRSYCCTPPASEEFLPVPEDWVIPLGQGYGADQPASFTADFDDNIVSHPQSL